jgi:threonine/homoserine/homoserine lactone efflux protein
MDVTLLLKGFVVGFIMAIPVGPVGLLCTQRTLSHGRMHGLISGLGAATSDVLYASLAAFGLTIISNFMIAQQMWFRLFGGSFLFLLGIRIFLAKPAKTGSLAEKLCHFNNYTSTLLITLSNPMSILVSAGMFAGLGLVGLGADWGKAIQVVGGVFLGSMFWWIALSAFVGIFHKKAGDNTIVLLARIFGSIITSLGIIIIIIALL